MIRIHTATDADLEDLHRIAEDMQAKNERHYFERCLAEQDEKKRIILIATQDKHAIGYVQLIWVPTYSTFRRLGIPEIQDLNVVPDARGQGAGSMLVDACEAIAKEAGKQEMGISVGVTQSYGPAQRLYVKKGYIPDGTGMCYDDVPVRTEDLRSTLWHRANLLHHLLTIKMIKEL